MEYRISLTRISSNKKTGSIPVSTTSKSTCPKTCPLSKRGCYANYGPLRMHWDAISNGKRGTDLSTFLEQIKNLSPRQLWRHNQAGDLFGNGIKLDKKANFSLASANKGRFGFTYTHYDVVRSKHNREIVQRMNAKGFTVNLSANNLAHADTLADLNIAPVVAILPATQKHNTITPKGRKVVVCPATYRDNVTCQSCGLCQKQRQAIVGFPIHGVGKRQDGIRNS